MAAAVADVGLPAGYRAVVVGSTGAVGRELVAQLAASPQCGAVVAVTRRAVPAAEFGRVFPSLADTDAGKVEVAVTDFERLCDEAEGNGKGGNERSSSGSGSKSDSGDAETADAAAGSLNGSQLFAGAHFVMGCLGASPFSKRVDHDYAVAAEKLARRSASVTQFSLVSTSGASPTSMFGYMKVKGQVENVAREQGFSRLTLVRPGMLDRGDLRQARFKEKLAGWVGMKGINVKLVARAMIADAERAGAEDAGVSVLDGNATLTRLAKSAAPVSASAAAGDEE
jgi:oxidoreductase